LIKHKESSESQKHRQEDQQQRTNANYLKETKPSVENMDIYKLKDPKQLKSREKEREHDPRLQQTKKNGEMNFERLN
jgi:superfamily II RNA helicase